MTTRPTQPDKSQILDSLSIEALRQGQSVWFRVVSGSMRPLMQIGDAIHIEPATPHDLHIGDIAAFQTPAGLVVHRITHLLPSIARFIEMGDGMLKANEIPGDAIAGRVRVIQHGDRVIDLRKPIAQRVGSVTAWLRYQFYNWYEHSRNRLARLVYRKTARMLTRVGSTVVRLTCVSADLAARPSTETGQ